MKLTKSFLVLTVFLLFVTGIYSFSKVICLDNVESALSKARKENKNIALSVTAEWCPYCQKMKKEIFETDYGEKLFKDFICVEVDFDTSYGQEIKRKYRIISLPTVVFLDSRGKEIDRIIGYSGKDWFSNLVNKCLERKDPLPDLKKKLKNDPDNPELLFEVGQRVLQRGNEKEGIELLTRILKFDPENSSNYTDNALFVLGRYYSRVKENPEEGLKYWRELFLKFPESDSGGGALSWMLRAYSDLNKIDEAENLLKNELNKNPDNPYFYYSIGYFYLSYKKENLKDVLPYIKRSLKLTPNNLQVLSISARIYESLKMTKEAIAVLERALKLYPDNKDLQHKLEKLKKQEKMD